MSEAVPSILLLLQNKAVRCVPIKNRVPWFQMNQFTDLFCFFDLLDSFKRIYVSFSARSELKYLNLRAEVQFDKRTQVYRNNPLIPVDLPVYNPEIQIDLKELLKLTFLVF